MDLQGQNGLLTTWREGWRARGWIAYVVAALLTAFYLDLYFTEHLTPVARALQLPSKWMLYGALYCVAMIGGAAYYLRRHGNSRYNQVRIAVNVGIQVALAFLLPLIMPWFGGNEFYFSYLWPLDWYKLQPGTLAGLPVYLALFSIVGSLIVAPLLAYRYGKRWYCSWVCGCGGLANTFGDPWRHLTSKSTQAWRFEKVAVHTVMFLAIASTALLALDYVIAGQHGTFHWIVAGEQVWSVKKLYGLVIGSILAGVVGVGLYPLFGPRVWCRNFCPMAAMLGLFQKLGRFRIRVKEDMCISCGNCSTYCEMGIDVRSYAQSNQSFTRAACVGCGMCAHVCPRGVLKLENVAPLQADKERVRLPVVDL
ncbi:MAG: 4Fe-4S binding protein [Sandaracinaceae bacterium]|nr:4Fe-4S binding protein [Sandaracinaceae bacterium]